jgi:hypothetical protein
MFNEKICSNLFPISVFGFWLLPAGPNFLLFSLFQLCFLRPVVFSRSVAVPAGVASKASFFRSVRLAEGIARTTLISLHPDPRALGWFPRVSLGPGRVSHLYSG